MYKYVHMYSITIIYFIMYLLIKFLTSYKFENSNISRAKMLKWTRHTADVACCIYRSSLSFKESTTVVRATRHVQQLLPRKLSNVICFACTMATIRYYSCAHYILYCSKFCIRNVVWHSVDMHIILQVYVVICLFA